MIRIEFDDRNLPLAEAIGQALVDYAKVGYEGMIVPTTTEIAKAAKTEELAKVVDLNPPGTKAVKTEEPAKEPNLNSPGTKVAPPDDVDEHGVTFDPAYCGKAADPFYGSGKRKGQWKKKRGVADKDYDLWYSAQLLELPMTGAGAGPNVGGAVNTAAAFGGEQAEAAATVPTDPGLLMKWIAEQQAAERITQDDVDLAYIEAKLEIMSLFDSDPEKVKANVEALYEILVKRAAR